MAKKLYEEASVQAIADAIRAKNGGTETYKIAQMGGAVRAIPSKDNIVHADIPDYIKTAALEVAKKVQAVRTSESIVFIAASDAHQLDTSADIVNGNLHAGMAMKALAYILPGIDFACYLGDYTTGSATTTLAEGRQHFAEINAYIDEAFPASRSFAPLATTTACSTARRRMAACFQWPSCTACAALITPERLWAAPPMVTAIGTSRAKSCG